MITKTYTIASNRYFIRADSGIFPPKLLPWSLEKFSIPQVYIGGLAPFYDTARAEEKTVGAELCLAGISLTMEAFIYNK